jgi:hypothetical protein
MITLFCFLFALVLSGSSVIFLQDYRVDALVEKHVESNKTTPVNGFRINIFFQSGNHSRGGAMAAQNAFSERFPGMKSYVIFEEPYFRVNIGNFRTRLEAAATLDYLKDTYPQAFIVRDVLNVRDLLRIVSVDEEELDEED